MNKCMKYEVQNTFVSRRRNAGVRGMGGEKVGRYRKKKNAIILELGAGIHLIIDIHTCIHASVPQDEKRICQISHWVLSSTWGFMAIHTCMYAVSRTCSRNSRRGFIGCFCPKGDRNELILYEMIKNAQSIFKSVSESSDLFLQGGEFHAK